VLVAGTLIGAGAIGVTMLLLFGTGVAHIEPTLLSAENIPGAAAWGPTALRVTALLAPAALWEELVFRGFLWTVALDAGGIRVARWSTACAFGVIHLLNPGAGVLSTLVVVTAGFCLGALRERTASLPAAWLAHFAWNWVMAVLLHVPVSGMAFDTPGYRTVINGPAWWTGGTWGPEGGAAALLVISGALALSMRATGWRSFRTASDSR
jgi:membrane protease YdiL (CAAX protease family)